MVQLVLRIPTSLNDWGNCRLLSVQAYCHWFLDRRCARNGLLFIHFGLHRFRKEKQQTDRTDWYIHYWPWLLKQITRYLLCNAP